MDGGRAPPPARVIPDGFRSRRYPASYRADAISAGVTGWTEGMTHTEPSVLEVDHSDTTRPVFAARLAFSP